MNWIRVLIVMWAGVIALSLLATITRFPMPALVENTATSLVLTGMVIGAFHYAYGLVRKEPSRLLILGYIGGMLPAAAISWRFTPVWLWPSHAYLAHLMVGALVFPVASGVATLLWYAFELRREDLRPSFIRATLA